MRSAFWTRVWLRVEPPVYRVAIFALALWTHRKLFHRCAGAIVRHRFNDRKTRTAVRAVCEWVTKPSIVWIDNFAQAIGTGSDVGKDQYRLVAVLFALADFESVVADRIYKGGFQALDQRARRFLVFDAQQELAHRIRRAFGFDEN